MTTPKYTFRKGERLSKKVYIDNLFESNRSFLCYPLKFFYKKIEDEQAFPLQVLIIVPKKRLRKAVDRNLIKRRIREAYRMEKIEIIEKLDNPKEVLLLGVMYLCDKKMHYNQIKSAMEYGIKRLRAEV